MADKLRGHGKPTPETVGRVGQHYINLDTETEYICVGMRSEPIYEFKSVYPHDYIKIKTHAGIKTTYAWYMILGTGTGDPGGSGGSGTGGGTGEDETQTYILVDEDGNEVTAVLVGEEVIFDATPNDIREGKTAVTDAGVTVGTKDIPAYHTFGGFKAVPVGSEFVITIKRYDYTKLQVVICAFNTNAANSVAAEKVVIDSVVYPVGSTEKLSDVTTDSDTQSIKLGITNEGPRPCIMRYITYKEEA